MFSTCVSAARPARWRQEVQISPRWSCYSSNTSGLYSCCRRKSWYAKWSPAVNAEWFFCLPLLFLPLCTAVTTVGCNLMYISSSFHLLTLNYLLNSVLHLLSADVHETKPFFSFTLQNAWKNSLCKVNVDEFHFQTPPNQTFKTKYRFTSISFSN